MSEIVQLTTLHECYRFRFPFQATEVWQEVWIEPLACLGTRFASDVNKLRIYYLPEPVDALCMRSRIS